MYDISKPYLVFDTHCLSRHNTHTGYIFRYYEPYVDKVREYFFAHIAEAQVFAIYRAAVLVMNPKAAPRRSRIDEQQMSLEGYFQSHHGVAYDY